MARPKTKTAEELKETKRAEGARFRKRHPNKHKEWWLKRNYGITLAQRDELIRRQDGKCAICKNLLILEAGSNPVHIDHDHQTGRIRGILCRACNTGIGNLRDSADLCLAAASYLSSGV